MRIYDTIIFDSEFELLEHRLAETYDLVDVIVLVEAAQTFQEETKPLHFQEGRKQFEWASPKLRHVTLAHLPGKTTWEREAFQRNAIQLGLYDAEPDDVILILDADEIPSRGLLTMLRENGLHRPHRLLMTRHYGRFDTLAPRSACCVNPNDPFPFAVPHLYPGSWDKLGPEWWCTPGVAVRFQDIRGDTETTLPPRTPNSLRRASASAPRLEHAGRHLSSVLNGSALRTKLSHFSHSEHCDETSLSTIHLNRAGQAGVHARGWWYAEKPSGQLPQDLERLCVGTKHWKESYKDSPIMRRAVRTWAWTRLSSNIPRSLVAQVDINFEKIFALILLPLLMADCLRAALAFWSRPSQASRHSTTH